MRQRISITVESEPDDTLALLGQMEGIWQCTSSQGRWAARAMATKHMGFGQTPRAAMRLALELDKLASESQAIRKRISPAGQVPADQPDRRRARAALWDDDE